MARLLGFVFGKVAPGALAAALVGLGAGYLRAAEGVFLVGLQGMAVGGLLGHLAARPARRDATGDWPFSLRLGATLSVTLVFWVFQALGADLTLDGARPGHWLSALLNGELRELFLGSSRFNSHEFEPGATGWALLGLLDLGLQVFLTIIAFGVTVASRCPGCNARRRSARCAACGRTPEATRVPVPEGALGALLAPAATALVVYVGLVVAARAAEPRFDPLQERRSRTWDPQAAQRLHDATQEALAKSAACDALEGAAERIRCRDAVQTELSRALEASRQ